MNERIQELAWAAEDYAESIVDQGGGFHQAYTRKFAELIVKECVKVCADRGTHHDGLYSAWAVDCSKRIEKHFGVE